MTITVGMCADAVNRGSVVVVRGDARLGGMVYEKTDAGIVEHYPERRDDGQDVKTAKRLMPESKWLASMNDAIHNPDIDVKIRSKKSQTALPLWYTGFSD